MPSPKQALRCSGKNRRGGPCKAWAIVGGTVCVAHGGRAPQVRAAAARRESERSVTVAVGRMLARLDVDPVGDPFTELAKLAGQAVAWKDALAEKVNELTGDGCARCRDGDSDGAADRIRYAAAGAGTEQLRSEVALFERAMDRCGSLLSSIAKLDIDDRMARISDRQAEVVIRAVDAALAAVGVTGDDATRGRQVAARELRGPR